MVKPKASLVLRDLEEKYAPEPVSPKFERIYQDMTLGHMRSVLHEKLNRHFLAINDRAETTRHYWADPSRDLIALIKELRQDLHNLRRVGTPLKLVDAYETVLERCEPWLSQSGGSTIPEDFELIEVLEHEEAIIDASGAVGTLKNFTEGELSVKRQIIGEGSYAQVFRYIDPNYGKTFAVKRAKKSVSERDLIRFQQEFKIMKGLDFPYILEVYNYDTSRNEYSMEYCDETLRSYINRRNSELSLSTRKRIALQFLYGMNYLHRKNVLHRDISYQNVLVKVFDLDSVIIKLSDFGLAKEHSSEFTRTDTEIRGTIIDPQLESFKNYSIANEIYAIGAVLSFIFTGKQSLQNNIPDIGPIVRTCTAPDIDTRYKSALQIIDEIEKLPF